MKNLESVMTFLFVNTILRKKERKDRLKLLEFLFVRIFLWFCFKKLRKVQYVILIYKWKRLILVKFNFITISCLTNFSELILLLF